MVLPAIQKRLNEKFRVQQVTDRIVRIAERDPYKLTPFIYLIKPDKPGNMGVIIDTGTGWGDLVGFLKEHYQLGTQYLPSVLVINTHNHFDHIGCNYQFSNAENGKATFCEDVCMGNLDTDYTLSYKGPDRNPKWENHVVMMKNYVITKWLGDREKIQLSHDDPCEYLEIVHIPGHTPDSIAIYFAKERRLFVGDFICRGHDVIATCSSSSIREFEASAKIMLNFIESKQQQSTSQNEVLMCCGHMNASLEVKSLRKFIKLLENINSGRSEGTGVGNRRFVCDSDPQLSILVKGTQLPSHQAVGSE